MEEIKVGDFIRSNDGYIAKIIEIKKAKRDCDTYYCTDVIMANGFYEHIKKHSPNIIDLIEEGDYVNGTEVVTVYGYDRYGNDKDELGIIEVVGEEAWGIYLTDIKKIKDIVTKEQFEQMKYIVGDE